MNNQDYTFPGYAKILHAGMAIFGISAFLTAELAEHGAESTGYYLHAYLGFSLASFIFARAVGGISGSGCMRFSGWSPFSRRQWRLALEDVRSLSRLRVPNRNMHEGLAGLTQAFGLAVFALMAATGSGLFLLKGGPDTDLFEAFEETREIGEVLIPLYLLLHVGSVVVHSLAGSPIWHRMWKFSASGNENQSKIVPVHHHDES
jgi:cytochrome b